MNDVDRAAGSAHGRPAAHPDETLSAVGPRTPCGEYLRRYWHPVGVSATVTERPQKVRILGEDLVLFRNKAGVAGLLYPRCMHRGSSLFYGKATEEGLRCCYHGWVFAVDGRCLEQPCEPGGGLHRGKVRQPWYPVEERYGLVFAYLGPLEKKPVLPRYDILEDLGPGELIEVAGNGNGFPGYNDHVEEPIIPYHWLQNWENLVDPFHTQVLHATFSGPQFLPEFAIMPKVDFESIETGVTYCARRELGDGRTLERINMCLLPNVATIPSIDLSTVRKPWLAWYVPVDGTHHRGFFLARGETTGNFRALKYPNGKTWRQLSESERQDLPGDFEAQSSQGAVSLHSEEHLATSDRGIALLRRMMKQQIKIVAEGGDPIGVVFDPAQATVKIRSGNAYRET